MGRVTFMVPHYEEVIISSPYGKRDDPNNPGTIKKHNGIDYALDIGKRVRASASGQVVRASWHGGLGNLIIIDHAPVEEKGGRKIFTFYAHLKEIGVDLREFVLKGEDIGFSGDTGTLAKREHLHFGLFDSKYAKDKLKWKTEGTTGVEGYNASNPENYIGHGYELDGAILDINDLNEKTTEKVRRVMELDTTVDRKNGLWHSDVIIDDKIEGYLDNRNLELALEFTLQEALEFLRKPMNERETDTYYV